MTASFSSAFIRPWRSPTGCGAKALRSVSAPVVASARSVFSDSSTSG